MKGGQVASRIETQDSVALIVAIEAIGGRLADAPYDVVERVGRVSFEKVDDIEVRWDHGVIVVSVKDKSLGLSDLKAELVRFAALGMSSSYMYAAFRIEAPSLSGSGARTFADDLERLHSVAASGIISEWIQCRNDFDSVYGISAKVAANTVLSVRDLRRDAATTRAIFASTFRSVFPVQNFSDVALVSLFDEYTSSHMAKSRRRRRTVLLRELQDAILLPLLPVDFIASSSSYLRTPIGYVLDPRRQVANARDYSLKRAAYKNILRRWWKHTWKMTLADFLYRGPIRCPMCNHAVVRAMIGTRGFVCSGCGYQPFLTVLYACDCRSAVPLVRQPSTDGLAVFTELVSEIRREPRTCDNCNRRILPENMFGRIFGFSAPWPVESFSQKMLIDFRISIGWNGFQFRVPGETPLTLLNKGAWDPADPDAFNPSVQ
ncbi:hypothetical protein [Lentzea sp. NPDC004782]|uniref:hypothetical protein n=1 Tax=Lentzea sp. NPDC004782 TaxID=3154458 RepID=UPI0033BF9EB0